MGRTRRMAVGFTALLIAGVSWILCLHFFFAREVGNFRQPGGLSPRAKQLARRHVQLWTETGLRAVELARMRARNPEWDLMARSFTVWSLAEMGLRNPAGKAEYLRTMDLIIQETLQLEKDEGIYFCLMPAAKSREYQLQPARNQFLDGEIALMLASRRLLAEQPAYQSLLRERMEIMLARMRQSPVLSAESYPHTCWTFDNVISLVAIRLADCLDGTDHSAFLEQWLAGAKKSLVDRKTGLLITSYTPDGERLKGPEGSSVWMVAHCLRVLDEDFARDQYRRAKQEFSGSLASFAWSHKWPATDAGATGGGVEPVIPGLQISAGASGMAFIGASSFDDADYLRSLAATLDFAAFPTMREGRLKYCASNQVGDAVMLYATVLGPMWEQIKRRHKQ